MANQTVRTKKTEPKARVLAAREYRQSTPKFPESWYKAAGLLKHKRKALERHLRSIRNEWDRKR